MARRGVGPAARRELEGGRRGGLTLRGAAGVTLGGAAREAGYRRVWRGVTGPS